MVFDSSRVSRRDFLRVGLSLAAAPSLFACADSTVPTVSPRLVARPGIPTLSAEAGVITDLGLGGARDGFFYIPTGYNPSSPAPLVVALHGAGGDALTWHSYVARAETRGYVLLAPDSRDRTWDLILGYYGPDVDFMDAALAHVFDRCVIDPARCCLAGFSDGASYSLSVGRANGDLFRHVIGYSPGFVEMTGAALGAPAMFISHGSEDPILSFEYTRDTIVSDLRSEGLNVTFRQFVGGHTVPADISDEALDWFLTVPA